MSQEISFSFLFFLNQNYTRVYRQAGRVPPALLSFLFILSYGEVMDKLELEWPPMPEGVEPSYDNQQAILFLILFDGRTEDRWVP